MMVMITMMNMMNLQFCVLEMDFRTDVNSFQPTFFPFLFQKSFSEELEKQKILQQFQSQHPELDLSELIAKASSASPTASSSAQTFNITSESSPSSSQP